MWKTNGVDVALRCLMYYAGNLQNENEHSVLQYWGCRSIYRPDRLSFSCCSCWITLHEMDWLINDKHDWHRICLSIGLYKVKIVTTCPWLYVVFLLNRSARNTGWCLNISRGNDSLIGIFAVSNRAFCNFVNVCFSYSSCIHYYYRGLLPTTVD